MCHVGVIHLVRRSNGPQPLARFLESYAVHPGGIEHDLMIVFKGFQQGALPSEYSTLLKDVPHKVLFVPDRAFDIGSYFTAAETVNYKFLCFLNSYSIILDENWLEKMHRHLVRPEIGIVGATASYESHISNCFYQLQHPLPGIRPSRFLLRRMLGAYRRERKIKYLQHNYSPFPNYHLRTNAFMISRELMLSLKRGRLLRKADAEKFESGKEGLTRQVLATGLDAVVIGRDGNSYTTTQWPQSRTFRMGNQENLLVADNRTLEYEQASDADKRELCHRTWGEHLNVQSAHETVVAP